MFVFALGDTWNKEIGRHTCCGSNHTYHKSTCPNRTAGIPGRASDPEFINVQTCKADGNTSGECAKRLNMPLDQVNELWLMS